MIKELSIQIACCLTVLGFSLYSYIDQQNDVTELRIQLPEFAKELKAIQEENMRLQYEIDQFENPQHLMHLSRQSEYSHLKHPLMREVVTLEEGVALQLPIPTEEALPTRKPASALATSSH